jgi:uncharacterized protein YhjY with autotransporter beta-barrel domain
MTISFRLCRAVALAFCGGALGPAAAGSQGIPGSGADLFLHDSFFESFSARLADQLDNRMRHARRSGGGLYVTGLTGPDEEWSAYRAAAEYDPQVALKLAAAEAERALERERGKSPFGPAMALPRGMGIFLLGDTGMGEARLGADTARAFWTHSISGGMDYRFADALLAGFAVSYSGGEADLGSEDYLSKSMTWSLFASLSDGPWHVDGSFNMGSLSFGAARDEAVPLYRADQERVLGSGSHVWTHVDTGYSFRLGLVEAGPVAEFRHARARFDGFSASEGSAAMAVPGREVDYARFGIGAAASIDVNFGEQSGANLWGRATWQTRFGDADAAVEAALEDGASVMLQGIVPDRSFVRTQVGFTADLGGGTEADFSYRTDLGRDDWSSHTIAASVRVKF